MGIAIERAAVVLGFLTLTAALAVFASCKTIPSLLKRLGMKDPASSETFQSFYFLHGFFWQAFVLLLVIHLSLGLVYVITAGSGSPEFHQHLVIISFGFATALSYGVIFASCRITNKYFSSSLKSGSFAGRGYQVLYALHSYYWLVFFALIATHFSFVYSAVRFWPMS
jgi:hypothetical protein